MRDRSTAVAVGVREPLHQLTGFWRRFGSQLVNQVHQRGAGAPGFTQDLLSTAKLWQRLQDGLHQLGVAAPEAVNGAPLRSPTQ